MNLSSIIDADITIDIPEQDPHRVFFLPLGLSNVQRQLSEVLVSLHKPSLLKTLKGEPLTQEKPGALSSDALFDLLARNQLLIANHPYLLVEHYMPKRLLLMESHERLLEASDKFAKFDKLLGAIGDLRLNVLVVGHNIKELDLIEAFILGRAVTYKRYSGTPLHVEQKAKNQGSPDEAGSPDKKNSKDDDYIPKKKRDKIPQQVRLHLITSQQLTSIPFTAVRPQFIVSFDALLDENNINFQHLRHSSTFDGQPVPLIKLIVMQSHLHGLISNNDILHKSTKESLLSSLVERDVDHTSEHNDQCGVLFGNIRKFFQNPLSSNWPIKGLPPFKHYNTEQVIESLEKTPPLRPSDELQNKKIKLESVKVPEEMTLSEYKSLMAKLTIEKINNVQGMIEENRSKLRSLRLISTLKHASEDTLKLSIGTVFKDSLKLKEDAAAAEKRYERLESDYEKIHEKEKELEKKKDVLDLIASGETKLDDAELDKEIAELEVTLAALETETSELSGKADELRQEYQTTTSTAADKATRVKALTAQNAEIVAKLDGQGQKLRKLVHEEQRLNQKDEIETLKNELKFLEFYNGKLAQTVKERGATLSVGRNGRLHRSTTPYLT